MRGAVGSDEAARTRAWEAPALCSALPPPPSKTLPPPTMVMSSRRSVVVGYDVMRAPTPLRLPCSSILLSEPASSTDAVATCGV
jgi:hypothetical protein